MTARRATLRDDLGGFSSIVGVILVIAIVMALGAATFIMVSRVRESSHIEDDKPELGMSIDPNDPEATVVRASEDLDWVRDLRLTGDCTPTLNGAAFPTSEGTLVEGGDVLACDWGEQLVISSAEDQGNAVLFKHTF